MNAIIKFPLAVILIAVTGLFLYGYFSYRLPTTAAMEGFFLAHRSAFEQRNAQLLAKMAHNEEIDLGPAADVGYLWMRVDPNPRAYEGRIPRRVMYYTHQLGTGVGSRGTGIAYADPGAVKRTYPSIEAMVDDASKVEGFVGFSPIADSWYYFLWEAD